MVSEAHLNMWDSKNNNNYYNYQVCFKYVLIDYFFINLQKNKRKKFAKKTLQMAQK